MKIAQCSYGRVIEVAIIYNVSSTCTCRIGTMDSALEVDVSASDTSASISSSTSSESILSHLHDFLLCVIEHNGVNTGT